MGTQIRHFKALSKKNWYNYKRTWMGNLFEFACPFLLMVCMLYMRI